MTARGLVRIVTSRSGASVIASLSTAGALFATFRAGIAHGSVAVVGCWALFQGIFVVSRIADSGAGANLTRWTAEMCVLRLFPGLNRTIGAGLLLSTVPVALLGAALVYPATWFVSSRYAGQFSDTEFVLLALFSLTFAVFSSAATVLLSVIEGLGRLVLRSYIVVVSGVVGMAVVWPLTAIDPVAGLGLTYVLMSGVQLVGAVGAAAVLRRRVTRIADTSLRQIMGALWRETWHLSGVGLLRLTFEPTSKILLSFVGSLNDIAAFELALRISTQSRVLLQAALQPLLVAGARKGGPLGGTQQQFFVRAAQLAGHASVFLLVVQVVMAPVLSFIGFGSVSQPFLVFFSLLVAANTVNSLGLPGYFLQLSSGEIVPLLKIQGWMSVINLAGAAALGWTVGPVGVVLSYCAAFAFGGAACLSIEARVLQRSVWSLLRSIPRMDLIGIIATVSLGLAGGLALHHVDDRWVLVTAFVLCLTYCVVWSVRTLPGLRAVAGSQMSPRTADVKGRLT